jgi:hypothetical protein
MIASMSTKFDSIISCIRIPKSGSTSLSKMLNQVELRRLYLGSRQTIDSEYSMFQYVRYIRAAAKNNFVKYRNFSIKSVDNFLKENAKNGDILVGGHFTNNYVKENINQNIKIITIIRNQIKRIISDYVYSRKGYINKPFYLRWDAGVISRKSGMLDFDAFLDFMLENKAHYGNISSRFIGWTSNDDFSEFVKQNVLCWGRLENIDKFEKSCSEIFEKSIVLEKTNVSGSSTVIVPTKRQINLIEQINDLDMNLYESMS